MSKKTKLIIIGVFFAAMLMLVAVGLGYALEPLLLAFALAYLVYPLILKMEHRGLNRAVSVSIILVIILAVLFITIKAFLPFVVKEGWSFFKELPENLVKSLRVLEAFAMKAGVQLDLSSGGTDVLLKEQASKLTTDALTKVTGSLSGLFSNIFKWLMAILNALLVPLFFFFMILFYEKVKKEIKSYIPHKYLPLASSYMIRVNTILSGYIRGKLVVALILALMYGIGLHFIGLKYGLVIGFASGILSIIPYVGSIAGFVAAAMMGLASYQGPGLLIAICVVFTIAQLLETYIITPHLVGNSVGLNAFVTILAIIIGGNLMGVLGILIAIPAAAILKVILIDLKKEYQLALHEPQKKKKK